MNSFHSLSKNFILKTRLSLFLLLLFLGIPFSTLASTKKCQSVFNKKTVLNLPVDNPFRNISDFPISGIPFDKIKPEHILPALEVELKEAKKKIKEIKQKPANFKNTIEAIESYDQKLAIIYTTAYTLSNVNSQIRELLQEIESKIIELAMSVISDKNLFKKTEKIYQNQKIRESLSYEQIALLEDFYSSFIKEGGSLNKKDFKTLKDIMQKMNILSGQFSLNILKEENNYKKWIENETDLDGLPEYIKQAMKKQAIEENNPDKWLVTLSANIISAILKYAKKRTLRENIYQTISQSNFKNKYDNSKNVLELIHLRNQYAKLLGYKTYAEYSLINNSMAQSPKVVYEFLNKLRKPYTKKAFNTLKELKKFAKKENGLSDFKPWDLSFYANKYNEKYFNIDPKEFLPYFELNNVIGGLFTLAQKLFDIQFKETNKYSKFHKDVKVYEVTKKGRLMGVLYMDLFEREEKRSGAWALSFLNQGLVEGKQVRSHIMLATNFLKPSSSKASLLTSNDVTTLFHEFGHSLHNLLSNVHYSSFSGTHVSRDFVELPSQLMEKWAFHKDFVPLFAKHYKTGKVIPNHLIEKLNIKSFMGINNLFSLTYSLLDQVWHTKDPKLITGIKELETEAIGDLYLFPKECKSIISCSFNHIFSTGYDAKYYSYLWSNMLVAGVFKLFKKDIFDKKAAKAYREMLEKGGSVDAMELYEKLTGNKPQVEDLIKKPTRY